FADQAKYQAHAQRHKPLVRDAARHQCEMCMKPFRRPNVLRAHMKKAHDRVLASPARVMNNKPRSFQCHLCRRGFTRQQTLKAHVQRVHEAAEPEPEPDPVAEPEPEPEPAPVADYAPAACPNTQELAHAPFLLAFPHYTF
ncbi:PR domain zinc finger protein 5-like, partial [Pollicipes pollicipes]|uniref:PR domain zinc finger protein 5-like n=1 Tax=Pollicipes pollicipes TaxID=41117 RepID=UPI001885319C